MKKRASMSKKHSKKQFTKHAVKVNKKNLSRSPTVMRGGIRF